MSATRLGFAVGLACAAAAGPAIAADIARGGQLYRQHCASCHGATGISTWPGAPNLARREGLMRTDQSVLQVLRAGKGAMPGYQGMLSDVDLLSVVAYSRTLVR